MGWAFLSLRLESLTVFAQLPTIHMLPSACSLFYPCFACMYKNLVCGVFLLVENIQKSHSLVMSIHCSHNFSNTFFEGLIFVKDKNCKVVRNFDFMVQLVITYFQQCRGSYQRTGSTQTFFHNSLLHIISNISAKQNCRISSTQAVGSSMGEPHRG